MKVNEEFPVMMETEEREMVEKYLEPHHTMLEYGSGGSTLHFSQLVKDYVSVEHNAEWYKKIKHHIGDNCNLELIENTYNGYNIDSVFWNRLAPSSRADWGSLMSGDYYKLFKKYIEFPFSIGKKYDRILIDGRARPECAKYIYDAIDDDAVVFIHDFYKELYDEEGRHLRQGGRPHYHIVLEKYKLIDSTETLAVMVKPGGFLKRR
jgi:hypothetical protein